MRSSNRQIVLRLGSLLVILCLLAAPLCATRCTLTSCLQANAPQQSAGCHHPSAERQGSCALAATPAPSCVPADSLLTALPAQQFRLMPASSASNFRVVSAILNSSSFSRVSDAIASRITNRGSSPGDSLSLVSNSPLRL